MKSLVLTALSISIFAGCAKPKYGQPTEVKSEGGKTTYTFATALESSESAKTFKLKCTTPGNCPENVGELIFHPEDKKEEIIMCTFSLIADDIAISARHCISKELAKRGTACSGKVEFILLQHKSATLSDVFECDQVLSVPDEYVDSEKDQRDFAVFKMVRSRQAESTNPLIAPLKIDQSGVADGEKLTAIVADPDPTILGSTLRIATCSSIMSPVLDEDYAVATDPLLNLHNCQIFHGDSGSPLIDSSHKLRALVKSLVLPAPIDPKLIADAKDGGQAKRLVDTQNIINKGNFAKGVNLSCVNIPELSINILSNDACKIVENKLSFDSMNPLAQPGFDAKNNLRLQAVTDKLNKQSPVFQLEWTQPQLSELASPASTHIMSSEVSPFCFQGIYDQFSWKNQVTAPDSNGLSSYRMTLPVDLVDVNVDQMLNLISSFSTRTQTVLFRFKFSDLLESSTHSTKVSIERSGYVLSKTNKTEKEVGFCLFYEKK